MSRPIIYHGTPLTPAAALDQLAGRSFCVSYARRDDVVRVERVAKRIMYDCGEFKFYRDALLSGAPRQLRDWSDYFDWLDERLWDAHRFAVIPDMIDQPSEVQDELIRRWPFGQRGAPVWHTNEDVARLIRLAHEWPRVCIGSAGIHWKIGTPTWKARMHEAMDALERERAPALIHGLRMTAHARDLGLDSADSTSLAQNGHRYREPLFAGTPDEYRGVLAYADRLEGVRQ